MTRRLLLSVAVTSFDDPELDLPDALIWQRGLCEVLCANPFHYERVPVPEKLTSRALGQLIRETLRDTGPTDVLLIHVLSHGTRVGRSVCVLGSDGVPTTDASVGTWLDELAILATRAEGCPEVLFLLDFCHSGAAARDDLALQLADHSQPAWILAASRSAERAYDGRLTRAVTAVLADAATTGLGTAPEHPHVSFAQFSRAVAGAVAERWSAATHLAQRVTATAVDPAVVAPEFRFLANRHFSPDSAAIRRLRQDQTRDILPFLDSLFDVQHFAGRASGYSGPDRRREGYFKGRQRLLADLYGWSRAGGTGLRVITGAPGAGKSALLGLFVCAVHPELRAATSHLWRGYHRELPGVLTVRAAHLRGRTASDLQRSLAEQGQAPLIVLDALDEANASAADLIGIVRELATTARVVCGVRRTDAFDPLLDGDVIDLSNEREGLDAALVEYVEDRLCVVDRYTRDHGERRGRVATRVAAALSNRSAAERNSWGEFLVAGMYVSHLESGGTADPDVEEIPTDLPAVLDLDIKQRQSHSPWLRPVLAAVAHAFGDGMPATVVTDIVDLCSLSGDRPTSTEVRTALDDARFYFRHATEESDGTVLYRLFHQGLIDHLREFPFGPAVSSEAAVGLPERIGDRLLARVAAQPDTWRHAEGYLLRWAADHALHRIDDLLLDPGFLVHAWSQWVSPLLHHAVGTAARAHARVFAAAFSERHDQLSEWTRWILAKHAVLCGVPALAATLRQHRYSDLGPIPLWPTWGMAQVPAPAHRVVLTVDAALSGFELTTLAGRVAVAYTINHVHGAVALSDGADLSDDLSMSDAAVVFQDGRDRRLAALDLESAAGTRYGSNRPLAEVEVDGEPMLLLHRDSGGLIVVLRSRPDDLTRVIRTGNLSRRSVTRLGTIGSRALAMVGFADGTVETWHLDDQTPRYQTFRAHVGAVVDLRHGCDDAGRDVILTSGVDGTLRAWLCDDLPIWDGSRPGAPTLLDFQLLDRSTAPLMTRDARHQLRFHPRVTDPGWAVPWARNVTAVKYCSALGLNMVLYAVGAIVLARNLEDGTQVFVNSVGHKKAVIAMDVVAKLEGLVAVTGDRGGAIHVWRLPDGQLLGAATVGSVRALCCVEVAGRPMAVIGCADGTFWRWWLDDLPRPPLRQRAHASAVSSMATATVSGRAIGVTGGMDRFVKAWNLDDGTAHLAGVFRCDRAVTAVATVVIDDTLLMLATDVAGGMVWFTVGADTVGWSRLDAPATAICGTDRGFAVAFGTNIVHYACYPNGDTP